MVAVSDSTVVPLAIDEVRSRFVEMLPRIEAHARVYFRYLRCKHQAEEAVQETVCVAWKWLLGLNKRGKDARRFVSTLASYAARAVRCGRRLRGNESARDVLSPRAQRRHGFDVESLSISTRRSIDDLYSLPGGQRALDEYEERLTDNTRTPPPDAAAFRIDFRDFLQQIHARDRRLMGYLSLGNSAKRAAQEFHISPGRVSHLRRHGNANGPVSRAKLFAFAGTGARSKVDAQAP